MNRIFKKIIVLCILVVLIIPSQTFATGVINPSGNEEIDFSRALESALEKDESVENLNDTLDSLWQTHNDLLLAKQNIEQQLKRLERFEKLHEMESRTYQEQMEYEAYQMMYGDEPPKYTGQEMLDMFIKTRDLMHFEVYYEHQKLKNTRNTLDDSLELGVLASYIQILNLKETYEAQAFYTNIQKSILEDTAARYMEGLISESDYINSQKNYEITLLQLRQLERNLNNSTYQFNNLIGMPYLTKVNLGSDFLKPASFNEKGYKAYYAIALENRNDIANAQIDYDYKVLENTTYKKYLKSDLYTDIINSDTDLFEAESKLTDAKGSLEAEIYEAYYDVLAKQQDYELLATQLDNKRAEYNNFVLLYESGKMKKTDLDMSKYQLMLSENNLKGAYRAYNEAVIKFNKAIGKGPGYSIGGKTNAY